MYRNVGPCYYNSQWSHQMLVSRCSGVSPQVSLESYVGNDRYN